MGSSDRGQRLLDEGSPLDEPCGGAVTVVLDGDSAQLVAGLEHPLVAEAELG